MRIPFGKDLRYLVAVQCKNNESKDRPCLWVAKVHLLNPAIDAIDLLKGRRLFMLQLNNTTHLANRQRFLILWQKET